MSGFHQGSMDGYETSQPQKENGRDGEKSASASASARPEQAAGKKPCRQALRGRSSSGSRSASGKDGQVVQGGDRPQLRAYQIHKDQRRHGVGCEIGP